MHSHQLSADQLTKQHLHSLNHAVLTIIQHKKYPLHYQHTKRTHQDLKYRLLKLPTAPN